MSKADNENVRNALKVFVSDYGALEHLTYDRSVQVGGKTIFHQILRQFDIKNHISGPQRPNKNTAEAAICVMKKG